MEGFQRIQDAEILLHKESGGPITADQDGSVEGTPKTHITGPGCWNAGTYLFINVEAAVDTGDEAYFVDLLLQEEGGGFRNFGTWQVPAPTVEQVFLAPITNRNWDGHAYDEVKIRIRMTGSSPSIQLVARIAVVQI